MWKYFSPKREAKRERRISNSWKTKILRFLLLLTLALKPKLIESRFSNPLKIKLFEKKNGTRKLKKKWAGSFDKRNTNLFRGVWK